MDIREKVNLGAEVRDLYGARIREQLASGEIKPLVMPYSLLGVFILPILYLSIPHVKRPWLYRARFPLMAFIVAFSLNELAAGCTSENFAAAYAVGLTHSWGIVWSATLLIWMRPQFEAERVERRRRRSPRGGETNGSAHERNNSALRSETEQLQGAAPDEDVARYIKDYEYYWQAFPADEPFLTRLGWATDLVLSFRGTGWNWCIPVIPRFDKPEKPLSGELVKLDSIPICTPAGYRRATTRKEFIRARLHSMATSFLILDLCSVLMMKDPYNILGPTTHPLPPFLAALPPLALTCLRRTLGLASCFFALKLVFSLWQLVACLLLGGPLASVRGELWHYPSINGSPSAVLDRGLAGFWGAWWHQTFRAAFAAPAARLGIGSPGSPPASRAAAALLAFAASGALHAAGSHAEAGPTR
ncbi:Membrane bound o-acyl transferase family protein, partial [Pleurostoma richardsiae]